MVSKKSVKAKKNEKSCPSRYYTGIGITTNGNIISSVFPGYPADNNNLLVGDLIVEPQWTSHIPGPEGTKIHIKILRGTKTIELDIVREKVCG